MTDSYPKPLTPQDIKQAQAIHKVGVGTYRINESEGLKHLFKNTTNKRALMNVSDSPDDPEIIDNIIKVTGSNNYLYRNEHVNSDHISKLLNKTTDTNTIEGLSYKDSFNHKHIEQLIDDGSQHHQISLLFGHNKLKDISGEHKNKLIDKFKDPDFFSRLSTYSIKKNSKNLYEALPDLHNHLDTITNQRNLPDYFDAHSQHDHLENSLSLLEENPDWKNRNHKLTQFANETLTDFSSPNSSRKSAMGFDKLFPHLTDIQKDSFKTNIMNNINNFDYSSKKVEDGISILAKKDYLNHNDIKKLAFSPIHAETLNNMHHHINDDILKDLDIDTYKQLENNTYKSYSDPLSSKIIIKKRHDHNFLNDVVNFHKEKGEFSYGNFDTAMLHLPEKKQTEHLHDIVDNHYEGIYNPKEFFHEFEDRVDGSLSRKIFNKSHSHINDTSSSPIYQMVRNMHQHDPREGIQEEDIKNKIDTIQPDGTFRGENFLDKNGIFALYTLNNKEHNDKLSSIDKIKTNKVINLLLSQNIESTRYISNKITNLPQHHINHLVDNEYIDSKFKDKELPKLEELPDSQKFPDIKF